MYLLTYLLTLVKMFESKRSLVVAIPVLDLRHGVPFRNQSVIKATVVKIPAKISHILTPEKFRGKVGNTYE